MWSAKKSRTWLLVLKLLVSVGLVTWILKDVDFTEVGDVLQQTNFVLLMFAFLLFFVGYFLAATRWRLLMFIHGVRPPLTVLAQSFMGGVGGKNVLPSTIGGDVSRMYDVWRIAKDKASAVAGVVVDRGAGRVALRIWASARPTLNCMLTYSIRSSELLKISRGSGQSV